MWRNQLIFTEKILGNLFQDNITAAGVNECIVYFEATEYKITEIV